MEWHEDTFGRLERLKDERREEALQFLHDLVAGREYHEWLQLECKEVHGWPGPMTKDTLGDLAQEVSAFANCAGGLIIWGYKVKREHAKEKVVSTRVAFEQPQSFAEALNQKAPECTRPAVDDVRSISIAITAQTGSDSGLQSGYVITFVGKSDGGPHRAAAGPKKIKNKYYRRRSDRSEVMTHIELEEMFGRRPQPLLIPELTFAGSNDSARPLLHIVWHVWNTGRGMAVGVVLEVRIRSTWVPRMPLHDTGSAAVSGKRFFRNVVPLAPAVQQVAAVRRNEYTVVSGYIPMGGKPIRSEDGRVTFFRINMDWAAIEDTSNTHASGEVRFDWVLAAQDMQTKRGAVVLEINPTVAATMRGHLVQGGDTFQITGKPGETVRCYYEGKRAEIQ